MLSLPDCCVGETGASVEMAKGSERWGWRDGDKSPRSSREQMQATAFLNVHYEPRHFTFVTPIYGTPHCTDEDMETQGDFVPGLKSDGQELTTEARLRPEAVQLCPRDRTTHLTL